MGPDEVDETREERARLGEWRVGLNTVHARIAGRFKRAEVRERARRYLGGLLDRVERKNGWQLAEQMGEPSPDGVQRLLNAAHWDADAVRDDLRAYVVEHLGMPHGVLVIDETGFLKKGTKSVGVKRQYSGTAGRVENSQIGVFLAYASARGRAFLDRELYLPEEWAADAARRAEAGVPAAVGFATKGELAQTMLGRAFAAGVPAAWVAGDEVYGNAGHLRPWLEAEQRPYVLAVSCDHPVEVDGWRQRVDTAFAALPTAAWHRCSAGEGSQGPRLYDWAEIPLAAAGPTGLASWALARRSLSDPTELAYYRAFGPATTTLSTLARVAGARWAIEEGFERAKDLVGLDQYEVRRWQPWYRHMTLALLAHAYLEVTRAYATAAPDRDGGKKGGQIRRTP
ncbi:MAG TPA: IS701 family transposase [Candidatus Dormibacteraeota bacterium]|nr:IS701 family transposase [Candidatus Dormibacteraeota bacterium]